MKYFKNISIVVFLLWAIQFENCAQNITFSGDGLSSVLVENQTTKAIHTLSTGQILNVGGTVSPGAIVIPYASGEILKYTGISGNNKTVVADVPTTNKTISFIFKECVDADENHYPIVQLGTQWWMADNLRTTKFADGDPIPTTIPGTLDTSDETNPVYQWPSNGNESNVEGRGRVYTYYAASSNKGICPQGWQLPSNEEWNTLINYVGSDPGMKMKETNTNWWNAPNYATNATGFSARSTGNRHQNGYFEYFGSRVNYLTSTLSEGSTSNVVIRRFETTSKAVNLINTPRKHGHAVRCIKTDTVTYPSALKSFSTNGFTPYHLRPAIIDTTGIPAIVGACFDGTIICYKNDGTRIWEKKVNNHFPFDLAVADIDNDGMDEIFVATGGGTLDALDADGTHLWTYQSAAQLYQVCPIKTLVGNWVILTGGIEEVLFSLDVSGNLIKSYPAGDVVRHIRKGDIYGNGEEYAIVGLTSSGRNGDLTLMVSNPATLVPLWRKEKIATFPDRDRFMSMVLFDVNHDGRKDIVVSASWEYNGLIHAYDYAGKRILESSSPTVPNCNYRMLLLTDVKLKDGSEEFILGLYANYLIIYNKDGIIESVLKCKYDFTNATFDSKTNTFYLSCSVAGGDAIYALQLDQPGWKSAFESIQPVGKLAKIEQNINLIKSQIQNFQKPSYQKQENDVGVDGTKPSKNYDHLYFSTSPYRLQKITNPNDLWCKVVDSRFEYKYTQEELVQYVKDKEAKKEDFYLMAGHGTAMYMPLETMEKAIAAGPNHLRGFICAEFQSIDSRMELLVQYIINPLADLCKATGKQIVFENKNIFWGGTTYVPFWNNTLLNGKYHDVFLPGLEESNSRTQEISLAGRVGVWSVGALDHWLSRNITDNLCFDRMWEWSAPQVLSHTLRHLVLTTSLGADHLAVGVLSGPSSDELRKQVIPVYDMIEKGIIVIPKKHELLSVPDLCLGMKSPPSDLYLKDGTNSHGYNFPTDDHSPKVFDRLGTSWGGSPIADHDFSKYGYGCERRMLNFMPVTPYGLVAIVPDGVDIEKSSRFREKVSTDGQYFYDSGGQRIGAEAYKSIMLQKLEESAARLPVLVKGDVAWSVVRIDSVHVRITLVDPGYTDPDERNATVVLQHLKGLSCKDILSGETLPIQNDSISLKIPAGVFRIIDITHDVGDDTSWPGNEVPFTGIDKHPFPDKNELTFYPNPGSGELFVRIPKEFSGKALFYKVFDNSGRQIMNGSTKNADLFELNLSGYASGLYFIQLQSDNLKISGKYALQGKF